MTLEEIKPLFRGVTSIRKNSFQCLCPAHNDKEPSLTVATGEKQPIIMRCHAGCEQEKILEAIGLTMKDICKDGEFNADGRSKCIEYYRDKKGFKYIDEYEYKDENGKYLSHKFRFIKEDGSKTFVYATINEDSWKSGKHEKASIYRIEKLKDYNTVYVPEGEKDVKTLEDKGYNAVTFGSSGSWKREFTKYFEGKDVILLPDNDSAGEKGMEQVRKDISEIAKSVIVVKTSSRAKGDVTDFFMDGHTKDEFDRLVDKARLNVVANKCNMQFMNFIISLEEEPIIAPSFLVDRLIYKDAINLISGDPKTYKTYVAIDIAMSLIAQSKVFDTYEAYCKGPVVFISPEFDTRKRFIELANSRYIDYKKFSNLYMPSREQLEFIGWNKDKDAIIEIVKQVRPVLLVLDPLSYIFDGDINKNDEVLEMIRDLKKIIKEYGTTILLTHHNNRMNNEKRMNNVSGASAITRSADSIIYLERFKEDEEQDIFKTDEELDRSSKDIKLIKGVYRHGGEGYKYHKLSFVFHGDSTDITSERYSNKEEHGVAVKNVPRKESVAAIKNDIIAALNSGKLGIDFNREDVLNAIENNTGKAYETYKDYIKEALSLMVKAGILKSIRGKGYTFQSSIM